MRPPISLHAVSLILALVLIDSVSAAEERFDIVIKGGRVVDGTGSPWYVADIGIRDGKIFRIGRIDSQAEHTIDATGLIVAPGFIDMMGQTASPMLDDPATASNLLSQGITTINCGEGVSAAPLSDTDAKHTGWRTMAEYFQFLDMRGLPVNAVQTVGHTQVRQLVLGNVDRRPTSDELNRMKELVREGMQAGAIGLSTALIYPPAVFATTEEIASLAEVAGQYGGRYFTHMRNEGDRLLEAIDEAMEIGRSAKTPVHIFHLKAAGRANWGKMELAIARIKAARAAGQQVTADIYPYINNGLGIAALIHPRHFAEGEAKFISQLSDPAVQAAIRKEMETETGWENWYQHIGSDWDKLIVGSAADANYSSLTGQSLAAIAKAKGEDPWVTFFNLVRGEAFVLPESMTEANLIRAMKQEFISFCTDVGPAGGSGIASHPRAFGAFPKIMSRYVRDQGVITLEQAISQASAVAANEVMAYDRGKIGVGLAADVIVFDSDRIVDRATFAEPKRHAEGMKQVIVNGQLVWDNGTLTGKRPGKVLRGPGFRIEKIETSGPLPGGTSGSSLPPNGTTLLDELFRSFLEKHHVPGCSVALSHRGQLVYNRGFGYADIAARQPVTSKSVFRIASISKPITAVAILQLVEQKKLSLEDKVFEILHYEPHFEVGKTFDERQKQITIRHLLQHRGGWDRDESFDAMFQAIRFADELKIPPPAQPDDVIRCMLGLPLDFAPGERYAYSNYGYCLLGRVIEKLSGQSYEDYVKSHVLNPLGITSMRLGRSRMEHRFENEVRYYDPGTGPSVFAADRNQTVNFPYGAFNAEAMDAHGGWLATATDLVRFASAFDDPQHCPILSAGSIQQMFERPVSADSQAAAAKSDERWYSLGWNVRMTNETGSFVSWHTGSLPGTCTILIRRPNGQDIAVLFNSRISPTVEHLTRALERPLEIALDQIRVGSQ